MFNILKHALSLVNMRIFLNDYFIIIYIYNLNKAFSTLLVLNLVNSNLFLIDYMPNNF